MKIEVKAFIPKEVWLRFDDMMPSFDTDTTEQEKRLVLRILNIAAGTEARESPTDSYLKKDLAITLQQEGMGINAGIISKTEDGVEFALSLDVARISPGNERLLTGAIEDAFTSIGARVIPKEEVSMHL
jgi:hypothetical protein